MVCTKYKSKTFETYSGTLLFGLMMPGYDMDSLYVYICTLNPDTTNDLLRKVLKFSYPYKSN